MAEGFARAYGSDVMETASAGLAPATIVQPLTKEVMLAKNIKIDGQYPKDLSAINPGSFDVIVNMSGMRFPSKFAVELREWPIEDPIGRSEDVYIAVRDEIERRVMGLILELRRDARNGNVYLERGESGENERPAGKKEKRGAGDVLPEPR